MRINTNVSAIVANNNLSKAQSKLEASLQRLSSGFKINEASDDTTGMAVSMKMKLQLKGLERSDNNAADGISVIQTAEGALTEVQSMVQRMKELTVQAANDVNSPEERAAIQEEINALNEEINRITNDTDFNTKPLLDGNLSRRIYSDVRGVTQLDCSSNMISGIYAIDVNADAQQAQASLSMSGIPATITDDMAGTVDINGYAIDIKSGDTAEDVEYKIVSACSVIDCSAEKNGGNLDVSTNEYGSNIALNITCDNPALSAALGIGDGLKAEGKDADVNFSIDGSGDRIGFSDTAVITTLGNKVTVKDLNSKSLSFIIPQDMAGKTINQEITDIGTMRVHIGANEGQQLEIDLPQINTKTLGLEGLNVMTHDNASRAITKVDEALSKVSSARAKLGAYANRLDHTDSNLDISNENLTAALSRIIDTDMAEEMTEYTSQNVIAQAGTSMLSQANQRPESVLQLLQG